VIELVDLAEHPGGQVQRFQQFKADAAQLN
jgi:hypothetical protein